MKFQQLKTRKIPSTLNNRIPKTINEIEEIIKLCKRNKINIDIIYLPLYEKTYLANSKLIEESKKELLKITKFWDFAILDKYTTDEYYWYEESHYRPILGRKILKKIYKENFTGDEEYDKDFGIYRVNNI